MNRIWLAKTPIDVKIETEMSERQEFQRNRTLAELRSAQVVSENGRDDGLHEGGEEALSSKRKKDVQIPDGTVEEAHMTDNNRWVCKRWVFKKAISLDVFLERTHEIDAMKHHILCTSVYTRISDPFTILAMQG